MLTEPIKKDDLPDKAIVLMIERGPFTFSDADSSLRGLLCEIDGETHAATCNWIGEGETVTDIVGSLPLTDDEKSSIWLPVEDGGCVRFLQPDCLSLTEAAEACVGIYAFQSDPEPPSLVDRIREALGTEEDGDALVEIARNAHRAEQELAAIIKKEENRNVTKTKSIKLSHPHHDPNSNPADPKYQSRYRVEQVTNSVEFSPGQFLGKNEVDELCSSRGWTVNVTPVK